MEKKTPSISVIIAVYNQADYLEKVILSLINQTYKDFEIVIADDGSGSEVANVIASFQTQFDYPIKHVWHEDVAFRKTIIANEAVRQTNAPYLIFIDGDCILHHQFISRHIKRSRKGTVLSGRRIMLDEEITTRLTPQDVSSSAFEKKPFWINNTETKKKRGIYRPYLFWIMNFFSRGYWVFGSNFSMYKDDFISLNGYDESIIGRGLEDINLGQRIILKKLPILKLSHEAIQFHLFHYSKPVPHTELESKHISNPSNFYAEKGINN